MILYNPTVSGSLLVTGSLTTTGTITSQTLVVQTITSSIEFNTGSTRNGTLSTNTHEFTGSVSITGSAAALLSVNNSVLYVSSSGNVGIGTTSPNRLFEVTSGGDTGYIRVTGNRGNADGVHVGNVEFYNSFSSILVGEVRGITGTGGTQSSSGQLVFYTNNAGTYAERMRITSAGGLLINATSSTYGAASGYNLGVKGTSSQGFISIARTGQSLDSQGMIIGLDTATAYFSIIDNIPLSFATNNAERMRITSGGRVLISGDVWGTERFGVVLDGSLASSTGITAYTTNTGYNGSLIRVQAETAANTSWYGYELRSTGGILRYGIYGNGTVTAPSDERRKKNIETTRDGYLQDVCNLRVVKYNWKDDEEGKSKELGFVAQEVEKVFPKLVETGYDGMNNENEVKLLKQVVLIPILVKAIQEQQAKITALEEILQRNNIQ